MVCQFWRPCFLVGHQVRFTLAWLTWPDESQSGGQAGMPASAARAAAAGARSARRRRWVGRVGGSAGWGGGYPAIRSVDTLQAPAFLGIRTLGAKDSWAPCSKDLSGLRCPPLVCWLGLSARDLQMCRIGTARSRWPERLSRGPVRCA